MNRITTLKHTARIFTLLLPFLMIGGLIFSASAQAKVDVLFSPNGGVADRISTEIRKAQSHIDIAMYSLSHPTIVNDLKALSEQGIRIRLILNDARGEKEKSDDLESYGIDVRFTNVILHHKFGIVDGPETDTASVEASTLLTGSQNWSASADRRYDEDFLVFKGEEDRIRAFQAEFNHLWNHSRDYIGPASVGETAPELTRGGPATVFTSDNFIIKTYRGEWSFRTNVELSDGVAGNAIIDAINGAHESIQIANAHFRRRDIYFAIRRALERGVNVHIILDAQEYDWKLPTTLPADDTEHLDEDLARRGATVQYKVYSRYWNYQTAKQLHTKYMIVDGNEVITGSFNWSENSELKTLENLIKLGNHEALAYRLHFAKVSQYGKGQFESLLEEVESSNGYGPCHFDPIILNGAQIDQLRRGYSRGACR